MADRSITVKLGASVTGLVNGFKTAQQAAADWSSKTLSYIDKNEQHINTLSNTAGLVGAALTGFAVLAVKAFADFDSAMSSVQAATMETADNMALLRQAALDAGADTVYSATESASAIEELAKAGLSTADILGGALDGALSLASAGSLDVGDAAEIAASAMTQFGLSGSDVTHVADLLAAGAGKAQGDVSDLGAALNNVGTVASNTGYSIEETTGFLAAMASYGLTGAEAGTQLKSMLQSLQAPSSTAQKALDELGLSLYDNAGNTKSLTQFVGEYKASLEGKTQAEKDSYNATIFGSYGINAANVAYKEGADGIQEWIDAVDDQGYAAEVAATKLDNLAGDWEGLTGSIETALIGIGEGADGPLRALVQQADSVVDAFNGLPDGAKEATLAITGGSGLALLGVAGLGRLLTSVANVKTAMDTLKISAKGAATAASGIGGVLGIATVALSVWATNAAASKARTDALADSFDTITGSVTDASRALVAEAITEDGGLWIFNNPSAAENAEELGLSLDTLTDAILGNGDAMDEVQSKIKGAQDAYAEYEADGMDRTDLSFTEAQALSDQANAADLLKDAVGRLNGEYEDAQVVAAQQAEATGTSTSATTDATTATDEYSEALSAAADATTEAAEALAEWQEMVTAADESFIDLQGAFDDVISKNQEYAQSTADATDDSSDSWEDYYDGVLVSADDYIAQLQAQVDAQSAWETNMVDIAKRVNDGMTGEMADAANSMIDELLDLGPEGAAQVQLLHDMTDEQFEQVVSLWSQKGTDAVSEFVSQVEAYRNPSKTLDFDTTDAIAKLNTLKTKMTALGFGSTAALSITKSATGGAVSGPGTGTSDTAGLYALSNGEHVLTASDVTKLGGQAGVYALRAAVQSGRSIRGYASGGAVVPSTQYVAPAYMTASSAVAASAAPSAPAYFTDAQVAVLAAALAAGSAQGTAAGMSDLSSRYAYVSGRS